MWRDIYAHRPMPTDLTAQGFLDALPTMVMVFARDGTLSFVNSHALKFSGKTAQDLYAGAWREFVPGSKMAELRAALHAARPFSLELPLIRADGSEAWVEVMAVPQSSPVSMLCVVHDISAGKKAQLSSEAQATQFRLLADNLPVQIAYYEVQTFTCLFSNRAYAATNGFDEINIVGKTFAEVIGEKATAFIQPMVDRVVSEGVTVSYDRPATLPSGEQRWLEVSLIPHKGADGKAFACFVLISDITKHRVAEIEIRESEARLTTFMNASAEGIVFHQAGVIIDVNPALCRMVDTPYEELVGKSIVEFIPTEFRAEVLANVSSGGDATYESALLRDRKSVV